MFRIPPQGPNEMFAVCIFYQLTQGVCVGLVTLDPIGSKVEIVFLMKIKLGLKWKAVGSKVEIIFMQKLRLGLKWKAVGFKVEIISF